MLHSSSVHTPRQTIKTTASASVTPYSLLASDDCKVQTLTVSDQHATLLISTHSKTNDQNKGSTDSVQQDQDSANATATVVQSLLKLTVVPFHKLLLGSNPVLSTGTSDNNNDVKPEVNLLNHNPEASQNIISFLKEYEFKLKSESGAEYSYYHATPSSVSIQNNVGSTTSVKESDEIKDEKTSSLAHTAHSFFGAFDVELISPADKRQISRALPSLGSALVEETPELYNTIVKPYIKSITEGDSLGWIQNVIEVKKEKERLLVNTDEFIVNIDTKWRSHPPPLTTPREEWYGHPSCAQDLYCLGIVKSKDIATLRDLRGEHIDLLRNMQREGLKAIEAIYGVKSDQIRCFVHYQPQFYHFHVHFTRLENEIGSTVERGHLVSDILQNLEMDPLYYEKRTIVYKLRKDAPLYNLIANFTPNA
eukprot:CAMPEP_0176493354 /NCGR_PEP_ID=MMETSP0200_2-20121128/9505_1 /TAXON_ID=947934 /ORGANISM="Chaetoceros sp., Strain GSL56" /LENGTH=421 /DNA_ID=CAMNT_0017891013 /DNA_START=108 /DNA_END=1373 /DNA_ORIENTATION=+